MRAAVLIEPGRIEMEERQIPTPGPGDVLIRVSSVGVCGSDTHYYRHGRVGSFLVRQPLVLGHEAAGTIVGVGEGIDSSRIGERVSIEPQRPDPDSEETRRGHYNLCPHMRFFATPPVDGALCDYVTIGAGYAHRVPDSVSDDAAALCEPLSVGIAAVRKAGIDGGSRVLITGAGPIGIMVAQVARAYGATDIVVSDPDEPRRAQATAFGATEVLDPTVRPIGDYIYSSLLTSGARGCVHRRLRRAVGRRRRYPRGAADRHGRARRLGRRVDGVADAADPEPGAGADRGVPVCQHVADGDRACRVRSRGPRRDGDRALPIGEGRGRARL